MLSVVRIQNLAIIDELEVEFGPGLNVITGETGSGKSVLLRAIQLLSGNRAPAELLRRDASTCEVEGLFLLGERDRDNTDDMEEELRGLLEDDELLIRRVIDASGRSKLYLNGRLSTGAIVQRVSAALFDMTGQHQQQMLMDPAKHRAFLDRFGVPPEVLQRVQETYAEYQRHYRAHESFREESSARRDYMERLVFERDELRKSSLRPEELEEINRELNKLESVEALGQYAGEALALLDDEEQSVLGLLRKARSSIERGYEIDPDLNTTRELCEVAAVNLEEAYRSLADYAGALDADPVRLEALRDRQAELLRLERKYGKPIGELCLRLRRLEEELGAFEAGEFDAESLERRLNEAEKKLRTAEKALTSARKKAAERLCGAVNGELAAVNMPKARFDVEISEGQSSSHGADFVQFLLAANPGQPFQPLAKIASGGELSRILLVLKTLLNAEGASLQVFDEIDTGIGGLVAHVVGEKLRHVGRYSQVIAVTHAPQIAALADAHYVISKESSSSHTRALVRQLTADERVGELARMMAGKKVTKEFEDSARELLRVAALAESGPVAR